MKNNFKKMRCLFDIFYWTMENTRKKTMKAGGDVEAAVASAKVRVFANPGRNGAQNSARPNRSEAKRNE